MLRKTTTAAIIALSGLAFNASAEATEVSLEQLVSKMVSQAVVATKSELSNNVQERVLTASNMVSMDSEVQQNAKVSITDLSNSKEAQAKAE